MEFWPRFPLIWGGSDEGGYALGWRIRGGEWKAGIRCSAHVKITGGLTSDFLAFFDGGFKQTRTCKSLILARLVLETLELLDDPLQPVKEVREGVSGVGIWSLVCVPCSSGDTLDRGLTLSPDTMKG